MLLLFIKAFIFGIAVAAPFGPMCILCMRRTMVQGWRYGFATASGIAMSDAIYSAIAALGITSVSHFILAHSTEFDLIAGIFLGCFGIKIYFNNNEDVVTRNEKIFVSLPYSFGSSIIMTLTNPLTLMFFITVFTTLTPKGGFDYVSRMVTVAGVFTGSLSWSVGLVVSVTFFRDVINDRKRMLIDKITGALLMVFGLSEIWRAFF